MTVEEAVADLRFFLIVMPECGYLREDVQRVVKKAGQRVLAALAKEQKEEVQDDHLE